MNKYLGAVFSNLTFFIINSIFFLIITPVSIHLMGYEFFGLWSILNSIMLLSNIGSLGIETIVNKFAAEYKLNIDVKDYISEILSAGGVIILPMAILVAGILILSKNLISTHLAIDYQMQKQFSIAIFFLAGNIFPQFISTLLKGFLLSQLKNQTVRTIETFFSISIWLGAVLIVVLFGKNIAIIASWGLINSIVALIIYFIVLRRIFLIKLRINLEMVRKMLKFSGYMFLESIAITMFTQGDRVIIGYVLGPAIAGIYSVGTSIGLRIALISGQVTSVMLPFASLKDSINEHEKLYKIFRKLSQWVNLIVAGCAGMLILWMDKFLSVWISQDFAMKYSDPFRILIIAYALSTLSLPAHQTLTGLGKVKFTSLIYLSSSLVTLTGIYFFSRYFGLYGAVWANTILALLLTFNLYVYHKLAHRIPWKSVLRDYSLALIIPIATYSLLFINQSTSFKMLLSTALGITILIFVLRDSWARTWIWQQARLIARKGT